MAQMYTNVIVFGATGDVGRSVALEAHKRGAKVHLAMRDTTKSINSELDNIQNFSRITADLSDPKSIKSAIEATSATAASIYRVSTDEETYAASLRALSKTPPEAEVINGNRLADCIVPYDIRCVGGAVLVDRPSDSSKEIIYLFGPKLLITDETWGVVLANCPGASNIKVLRPSIEEIVRTTVQKGFPEAIARSIIDHQAKTNGELNCPEDLYKTGVANIRKYSGYEATGFKEYISTQRV